jgi:ABC-type antimicrobial peptide transport system permease subunit
MWATPLEIGRSTASRCSSLMCWGSILWPPTCNAERMASSRAALRILRSAKMFARTPGLSAALLLTIAFGVGSNAAVYGFVQGLTHPTSALGQDDKIVSIYTQNALHEAGPFSPTDYERLLRLPDTFDWVDAALIAPSEALVVDHTEVLTTAIVSPRLAGALNLPTGNGAVISDRMWRGEFGGKALTSHRDQIRVDNVSYSIVGTAPGGLEGLYRDRPVDVWICSPDLTPQDPERHGKDLWVVARLRGNKSISQAQVAAQQSLGKAGEIVIVGFRDLTPRTARLLSRVKALVAFAAAAVFLIACINVGSLLMARASRRSQETALRVALGASRRELAGDLLSESVVISFAGGTLGTLLAAWTAHIVPLFLFREDAERFVFVPHLATIFTGSLLCVATTVLFGMMPMAVTITDRPWEILRAEAGAVSRASRSLWTGIIVGQITLCCLAFIAAVFLQQNLRSSLEPDARDGRGDLVVLNAPALTRPADFTKVEQQASSMDGLVPRAWAARLPGNQPGWRFFKLQPPALQLRDVKMDIAWLTPGALNVLDNKPVAGRLFSVRDQMSRAGVVNEEAAAKLFDQDTVGRIIQDPTGERVEIVGVVRRKTTVTSKEQRPTIYYNDGRRADAAPPILNAIFRAPVAAPVQRVPLDVNIVSPGYFHTLDLPLVAGRRFPEAPDPIRVGVINQEAADLYFGERPLGTDIIDEQGVRTEIIGVVGSPSFGTFRRPTSPTVYFPMKQDCCPRMTLIMNAPKGDGRVLAEFRHRVEAVYGRDPAPPSIDTISAQLTRSAHPLLRIVQLIAKALVCVAMILAILGLFSSQNFAEYQRRREVGLLIALGAPRWKIFWNVLAAGLRFTLAGGLTGTFSGFLLLHILQGDTGTIDVRPWTWLIGPLISAMVVLLSGSIPAYRSSRLNPMMVMHGARSNRL